MKIPLNTPTLTPKVPFLPGMEEFVKAPMPQNNVKNKYGRDIYNLRLLAGLQSSGIIGIPSLLGFMPTRKSKPLAFHEARALWNKKRSLRGFFIHFFIADDKFDCIRKAPKRYLAMFKSADFIVAPDFSTYRNYPFPVLLKNGYDNMLLAAYYERNGVNVVPNIFWATPMFYDVLFSGQPKGKAICVNSKSIEIRDKKGIKQWLHGYKESIRRLCPSKVIRIGKIIPGEEEIFANPERHEVENEYINGLRNGR